MVAEIATASGVARRDRPDRSAPARRTHQIKLVQRHDPRLVACAEVGQDLLHGGRLLLDAGRAQVQHLHYQVRLGHLLEGRPERSHQVGRQLLDEADGVGQEQLATSRQLELAGGRVKRREELLLGAHTGARQRVQKRRLACVGVPDDGRGLERRPATPGALLVALGAHLLDLSVQVAHPLANPPLLDLDLLLAKAPARSHPSPPSAHLPVVGVRTDQPRQKVMQARRLDLQAPFMGAGVLSEDLQDHLGPVEHPRLQRQLEVSLLSRAQVLVAHDQVEGALLPHLAQRLDLAHPYEMSRVDIASSLHVGSDHLRTGCAGEIA